MEYLSPDRIASLIESYALPLLWAIIIFIVGRIVARIVSGAVAKIMTKNKVDETLEILQKSHLYRPDGLCHNCRH